MSTPPWLKKLTLSSRKGGSCSISCHALNLDPLPIGYRDGRVVETEIAGNRVRVAGLVSLGTSFGADGNLLTSTETFLDLMPQKPLGAIEVGLVRLKPGTDPEQVVSRLRQRLPKDVSVLTKQGFIDFEQNYCCLLYTSPSPRDRG